MILAHTPGPWHPWAFGPGHMVVDDVGSTIAILSGLGAPADYVLIRDDAEREANARLIASAPDLLAACLAVIREGEDTFVDPDDYSDSWKQVDAQLRTAVAKAIGKEVP